jgi:hypothetical protein
MKDLLSTLLCLVCLSFAQSSFTRAEEPFSVVITEDVVTASYIGNGPQWGGYEPIKRRIGSETLSDEDWTKTFKRVDFMKPKLIRIMITPNYYIEQGKLSNRRSGHFLFPILDYCEKNGITVIIGEWGHQKASQEGDICSRAWSDQSADFLKYLLLEKKYTCIKYYTMVNEPNGDWSSTKGNFDLWEKLIRLVYQKLQERGIADKVVILGPDIAIWTTGYLPWYHKTRDRLGDIVGAYDIHCYPDENIVRSGKYMEILDAYRKDSDISKPSMVGELAFKYKQGTPLRTENEQRAANDSAASASSQMFVYDAFYAVDMADVLCQCMIIGYAGAVLWYLDDAMYCKPENVPELNLCRWGFWNILGKEMLDKPEDEEIRPWFYTMSLLCRYFPTGSSIYRIEYPDKLGFRAVAGKWNGKTTIVLVNSGEAEYSIDLKMKNGTPLDNMFVYKFIAGNGREFKGTVDADGFPVPLAKKQTLDFSGGRSRTIRMHPRSFYLMTNIDYER